MQQCGEEWKAAKANNATNGQTWPEFLKSCRTQKASAPAAAPAAAPRCRACARASPGADLSAEARSRGADEAGRPPDRRRPVHHRIRGQGPLPVRHGGLGQHQVAYLSLRRARAATERPSRAPICARPTPAPPATAPRRAASARRPPSRNKPKGFAARRPKRGRAARTRRRVGHAPGARPTICGRRGFTVRGAATASAGRTPGPRTG